MEKNGRVKNKAPGLNSSNNDQNDEARLNNLRNMDNMLSLSS